MRPAASRPPMPTRARKRMPRPGRRGRVPATRTTAPRGRRQTGDKNTSLSAPPPPGGPLRQAPRRPDNATASELRQLSHHAPNKTMKINNTIARNVCRAPIAGTDCHLSEGLGEVIPVEHAPVAIPLTPLHRLKNVRHEELEEESRRREVGDDEPAQLAPPRGSLVVPPYPPCRAGRESRADPDAQQVAPDYQRLVQTRTPTKATSARKTGFQPVVPHLHRQPAPRRTSFQLVAHFPFRNGSAAMSKSPSR